MVDRRTFIGSVASGVLATPLGALAQQRGKVSRVGFLSLSSASEGVQNTAAFLKALRELGDIEGKNLVIEWRLPRAASTACRPSGRPGAVESRCDCRGSVGRDQRGPKSDSTIPIVRTTTGDPVGSGS